MSFADRDKDEQIGPDSMVPPQLTPEELAAKKLQDALEAQLAIDNENYALQAEI